MIIFFGILVIGLILLAAISPTSGKALATGLGALFGLCSIAFTQYLKWMQSVKERAQDARGLARALAAEIGIINAVLLAKSGTLNLVAGIDDEAFDGIDPDELLRYIQLPPSEVFNANVSKISLLEEIEKYGEFKKDEERFVERVVGFYEGLMDLRGEVSAAKLQKRKITLEEVLAIKDRLASKSKFAWILSERLREFIHLSESITAFKRTRPKSLADQLVKWIQNKLWT